MKNERRNNEYSQIKDNLFLYRPIYAKSIAIELSHSFICKLSTTTVQYKYNFRYWIKVYKQDWQRTI